MRRYVFWASIGVLLALSACDRAPDDDDARTASGTTADQKLPQSAPRRPAAAAPRAGLAIAYELQGVRGKRHVFQSKETCEAARAALVDVQAKEDMKLGDRGILFPDRPVLVCFPLVAAGRSELPSRSK